MLMQFVIIFGTLSFLTAGLQCFDAVGWVAGRASGLYKTEWWGAGMVICLERGADLHMAQLMPLPPLDSVRSLIWTLQMIYPFWLSCWSSSFLLYRYPRRKLHHLVWK